MLLAVAVSRFVAHVTRAPVPLVQIALGAAIFQVHLIEVDLDPEVFFVLLLPPLLFMDGWRIPKDELVREAPTILTLALGLVVFTVLGLGLCIHWLIPAMPLPVAFALAAALSPTDPVALSSITANTPMPPRMRRILQGESLFNDASGLVCMRVAVAAALTGTFSLSNAFGNFLWVALAGAAIGVSVAWLVSQTNAGPSVLLGDDGAAQILVTLLIPSGSYLLAEYFQCSGILAAVAAGITMGFTPHSHWQAVTRIRRTAVWDTVQFAANGSIFVLLGQQIPSILAAAGQTVRITGHQNPWWLGVYVVLIVAALGLLRFVWVAATLRLASFGQRRNAAAPPLPPGRMVLAMSLAGVRGAITLAGVLTLPLTLTKGVPFPGRDLAIFLAAGVIVLGLLLATLALPRILKGMSIEPDQLQLDAANRVRVAAADAGIAAVKEAADAMHDTDEDAAVVQQVRKRIVAAYQQRKTRYGDDSASPDDPAQADRIERALLLAGLRAERDEVLAEGPALGLKEVALRKLAREIDLQEARHSS